MAATNEDTIPINKDDVVGYLKANKAEKPCEACGENNWTIVADSDNNTNLGIPIVDAMKGVAGGNVNVIGIICNNCSNTRLLWQ